ncbi:MAG: hypothetical protein IPI90_14440 [Saprospiraceae bacterium]|nr:hypothetical protein [Candidatus Vicinibacter affinis]
MEKQSPRLLTPPPIDQHLTPTNLSLSLCSGSRLLIGKLLKSISQSWPNGERELLGVRRTICFTDFASGSRNLVDESASLEEVCEGLLREERHAGDLPDISRCHSF